MIFKCNCNYCEMNTFLWELSDSEVWVEIPKNGSYNLKQLKFNYDSRYSVESQPNSKIHKISKIDKFKHKSGFVVLRNPIDRFKSLLSHYFIRGGRLKMGQDWLKLINVETISTNNIANIVLDNWDMIESIGEPHHFNSQKSFIPNEFFDIDSKFYDLKNLSKIFGLNSGINSSNSSNITLDNHAKNTLYELYSDDFYLYEKFIK